MRLIVTGASGFIGRNVLLRAPRDWRVLALYNESADFESWVDGQRLSHVAPLCCNLLQTDAIRAVLRDEEPPIDAVLYLAANGDPTRSVERPHFDLEANAAALVNFLEHCHVDHLVYVSSGAVYDGLVGAISSRGFSGPMGPTSPLAR
jgi:nucleoside-diphosphate-sugar epimerase